MTKRKLTDLYRRGKKVVLDDGDGGVEIWIKKLNPVENETAVRRANAMRAKFLALRKNPESEVYLAARSELEDLDHDELVDYFVAEEVARRTGAIEARFAEESEWTNEDYLQGILDSWDNGMKDRYFEADKEEDRDPEAVNVFKELERYNTAVDKEIEEERLRLREEVKGKDDDHLLDLLTEKIVRLQADLTWMVEYRKCEIWMGTRDPLNHKKPYFGTRDEVDELDEKVNILIMAEFAELNVEVDEGKDSPRTQPSSPASALEKTEETEDSSGLGVAAL